MKKNALMLSVLLIVAFCFIVIIKDLNETNVENHINKLFMDKNKDNNLKSIIKIIPQIDWTKYNNKYDNGFEVMQWLYLRNKDIITEDEILSILKSTNNLDGALSEAYSNLIGSLFTNRQSEFLSALSKLTDSQFKLVINYLKYNFEYMDKSQKENIIWNLKKYKTDDKKVISALMNIIKILEE